MMKKDVGFLRMIAYFWQEKGDIERYVDFDIERLRKLSPDTATAWEDYKRADRQMDRMAEECEELAGRAEFDRGEE